jgi:hypothetical protein
MEGTMQQAAPGGCPLRSGTQVSLTVEFMVDVKGRWSRA